MATVVNDRDVLIMAAVPRFAAPTDRGMFLSPASAVFKLSASGQSASPASFVFNATLLNLPGAVSFSWTGGLAFSVNGNTATLDFANMSAVSGTVTASITVDGVTYAQSATITKLSDGSVGGIGDPGPRGNVSVSAAVASAVWSDADANAALSANGFGAAKNRDVVMLYKADRTWSQRKVFDGSAWQVLAEVFDASVLVKGSVLADAVDTRGLAIRDLQGRILLGAGVSLASDLAAPGTKNNEVDVTWWQRGASIPWAQNLETNNIVSSTDFGIVGPRGTSEDLWTAVENGNDGGQGGGWDAVAITLDPTKTYRFVVPIRKHAGTGAAHWGTSNVANLNQSVTASNPYFATTPTMTADSTWYLFIGYIFPANSTGHDHSGAGILNCSTGQFIATGTNYNFLPGQGTITHRAYQYYSSNGARQFFGRPMINLVDGTEPSLREYLANGVVLNTAITLNSNGSLSGAGGGQVTLPGMGQNSFRVVSAGGNATSVPASLGLYKNGALVFGVDRGYMLVAINRATGNITYSNTFDVYGAGAVTGGRDAAALASVLNSIGSDSLVVIYTSDEPSVNRMNGGLPAALYRHGASRAVFGSPFFQYRSAYVLIAIGGCGEGNGAEGYQGAVSNDTNSWVDESFSLLNGSLVGVSASFTPKSLQDYGYAGDLDATRGATFGTNVYGQINPANITTYIAGATIGLAQINTASIGYLSAISAELGSATISSAGFLRCGQTTFNSGTGWYLGMVGGVPKFSIGTSGGAGLRWDGTDLIIDNPKIGANMTAACSPDQYVLQRNSNQQFTDVFAGTFSVSTGNASSNLGYDWSVSSSTSQITINKYGQTSNQCSASVTGKGYSGQEFDLFINCTVTDLNNGVSRTCGAYIIVQIP